MLNIKYWVYGLLMGEKNPPKQNNLSEVIDVGFLLHLNGIQSCFGEVSVKSSAWYGNSMKHRHILKLLIWRWMQLRLCGPFDQTGVSKIIKLTRKILPPI